MKNYLFFFLLILFIGCGTSKNEKLEFLNKTDEYNKMREDYIKDITNRFKDREFYVKQIEKLQKEVENLQTYEDWTVSSDIKSELYHQIISNKNLLNSDGFIKSYNDIADKSLGMNLWMNAMFSSTMEKENEKIRQLIKDEKARVEMN